MAQQLKLLQLLRSFDSYDWRVCSAYIDGSVRPGHDCMTLYQHLREGRRQIQERAIDVVAVKRASFPSITDKSFTNVFSKLTLLVEDYLVHERTKKDKTNYNIALLKELSNRGLYGLFDKKATQLENQLTGEGEAVLFNEMHLLRLRHLQYFSDNPIKNKMGQGLLHQLNGHNHTFNAQYALLLQIAQLQLNEVSKPVEEIQEDSSRSALLSEMLEKILRFKEDPNSLLFGQLSDSLWSEDRRFSEELYIIIIELLIQQAHKEFRKGDVSVIHALLDLYERGFSTGWLLSNKVISENRLTNAVVTACAAEQYERAEKIIEEYGHLIVEEIRSSTIQILKAHLLFYKGRYDLLIELIRDYSFGTLSQNIIRRWMLLCAYYKMMDDDSAFVLNELRNYNNFFYNNRSKISKGQFNGSLNLSRIIHKMIKDGKAKEVADFAASCEQLIYRKWVSKEIGALSAPTS